MTQTGTEHHPRGKTHGNLLRHTILLGPMVVYLGIFFVYPLSGSLIESLFDPGFTLEYYLMMVKHPVYLRVFWNTLEISTAVTLLCILIGYPGSGCSLPPWCRGCCPSEPG